MREYVRTEGVWFRVYHELRQSTVWHFAPLAQQYHSRAFNGVRLDSICNYAVAWPSTRIDLETKKRPPERDICRTCFAKLGQAA